MHTYAHTLSEQPPCIHTPIHLPPSLPAQVIAHMMPDLPNVGWERDLESFAEFFENPAFRTDGLKLYPTLVIRGTGLYELWKKGLYRNYPPEKVGRGGGAEFGGVEAAISSARFSPAGVSWAA